MKKYVPLLLLLVVRQGICQDAPPLQLLLLDSLNLSNCVVGYTNFDNGGNTSVAHDDENIYKWSGASPYSSEGWGYFDAAGNEIPYIKRDRDLGQTFKYTGTSPAELKAINVQLGFGSNVVRPGMWAQKVSVQLFEVQGKPVVHDNGSSGSTMAFHGFPHNRFQNEIDPVRDDYFTGEIYKTIAVITGYTFPDKTQFGFENNQAEVPANHPVLKGKYLKFVLPAGRRLLLQPGKQYAFLIMIDSMGKERGFSLANNYMGSYPDGHGIRRDGNGEFPPVASNPAKDFTDPENSKALKSAHFPADFRKRTRIPPGTNGYPDVDTWRDLVFCIEVK